MGISLWKGREPHFPRNGLSHTRISLGMSEELYIYTYFSGSKTIVQTFTTQHAENKRFFLHFHSLYALKLCKLATVREKKITVHLSDLYNLIKRK